MPARGAAPSHAAGGEPAVGQLFAGRYLIERQVGKGGMGAVYLAVQEPLARMVAIKVLHGTADQTTVARFQREARLIAQLQHPHIVGLIDFGEDYGRLYLVMEYIDGEPLTAALEREAPFEPKRVVDIGLQIAEALAVAHDTQVVHRDIKPDNIMVLPTAGGGDFIKMLDFGVAKIRREGEAQNTVETKAGLIVGSLRYISPEQVENGEITTRTDMYSYGCVLYEMLAGRRVFDYASPADCAIAHITETPKPPEVDGQTLSGPLVDFIMRCLEKKPDRRPANAREAIQVLMACRDQPCVARGGPAAAPQRATPSAAGGIEPRAAPRAAVAVDPHAAPTLSLVPTGQAPAAPAAPANNAERRPDAQLRGRPSGADAFTIIGADASGGEGSNTSTSLEGVRLQPRIAPPAPPPGKGRAWMFIALALLVVGAVAVVLLVVVKPGAEAKPDVPVEASVDASGVAAQSEGDAAQVAAAPDAAVPPEETAQDPAAPEDVQAAATPPTPEEMAKGAMIKTEPPGAMVRVDKKLCQSPCIVPWDPASDPPRVRISKQGYIDIDLQLVRADRGTEQVLTLRKQQP